MAIKLRKKHARGDARSAERKQDVGYEVIARGIKFRHEWLDVAVGRKMRAYDQKRQQIQSK